MAWITNNTRQAIYRRDKYVCCYCGHTYSADKLTLDHIIAKSKGGSNKPNNLITACKSCNSKKGVKALKSFLKFLENMKIIGYGDASYILNNINNQRQRKLIYE